MSGNISKPVSASILSTAVAAVTPALATYRLIRHEAQEHQWNRKHDARGVSEAIKVRDRRLPFLMRVDGAEKALAKSVNLYGLHRLDSEVAAELMGKLYRALGSKPNRDLLDGTLSMLLEGDSLAYGTGQWEPINATSEILAIAVHKFLHEEDRRFPPLPGEVAKKCREVKQMLAAAHWWCDSWLDGLKRADAILFEFAHDEWERPYLLPQFRESRLRMLELHDDFGGRAPDDDESLTAFQQAVLDERAKLALEATLTKKIAAARKRTERKRTKPKPKRAFVIEPVITSGLG